MCKLQPITLDGDVNLTQFDSKFDYVKLHNLLSNDMLGTQSAKLLCGLFGSGKKVLIAHLILILVKRNARVLLCTRSNNVADFYIRQYFHVWYHEQNDENIKPIRIYDKSCPPKTLSKQCWTRWAGNYRLQWRFVFSLQVNDTILGYYVKENEKQFRDPNNEQRDQHKLIVTTFSALTNVENMLYRQQSIYHLIVEESNKIAEWEVLGRRTII